MKRIFILLLFCWAPVALGTPKALYPFPTVAQARQFDTLIAELRCLVCQNQNLKDSHAPLAKDLKDKIYVRIRNHESREAIIHYVTSRYGEFVLFKPPFEPATYFLWLGPFILLLSALGIFGWVIRKS